MDGKFVDKNGTHSENMNSQTTGRKVLSPEQYALAEENMPEQWRKDKSEQTADSSPSDLWVADASGGISPEQESLKEKKYQSLYYWNEQVSPLGTPSYENMPDFDKINEMEREEKKNLKKMSLRDLEAWKKEEPEKLKKDFAILYDEMPNSFMSTGGHKTAGLPVMITKEEAERQARILMQTAINAIYQKRKKHIEYNGFDIEPGSYISNLKNEYNSKVNSQCKEWEEDIGQVLRDAVDQFGAKNAYKIIWKRKLYDYNNPPPANIAEEGAVAAKNHFSEHNWVEIKGPSGRRIIVDPWPSGGRKVIPKVKHFGKDWYVYPDTVYRDNNATREKLKLERKREKEGKNENNKN